MILQCAVLFAFLALGELIVWLTDIPIPASIIGMLLLTAALRLRIVRLNQVAGAADFLVKNLGFFFVPPGVALMLHFNLIKDQWLPITVATVASTVIVLAVTGWAHQLTRKHIARHGIPRK